MEKAKTYAAIDIGSNAARLLIKRIDQNAAKRSGFKKLLLLRVPLRLGFDVFKAGKLSKKKMEQVVRLLKAYRQLMKIYGVETYRACATSAMRDAKNGKEVMQEVKKETGITIEIISGQEEARMIYENHVECMQDRKGNYMYVNVGGGSTEINLLSDGVLCASASYNLGTVRLLNDAVKPEVWERLATELALLTQGMTDISIIGSGGNINKLYRLAEKKDRKRQCFTVAALRELYEELLPLTPEERMDQYALKQDRADVIVPAAQIFLRIAEVIRATRIFVPVIGLADGIIDDLYLAEKRREE